MYIIYDLIFLFLLFFYFLPCYFIKRKYLGRRFIQRFGFFDKKLIDELKNKKQVIWIHGVSVGEAILACKLSKKLKQKLNNNNRVVISVTTTTGYKIAYNNKDNNDVLLYFPLDLSFVVRKFLKIINPVLIILIETELWPNLLAQTSKNDIPVVVANGRISDTSYRGYKYLNHILPSIFRNINSFCMQSESDFNKILSLGIKDNKVKMCGNMKFDINMVDLSKDKVEELKKWLNYKAYDDIFVCGSTHPGEEEIIIDICSSMISKNSNFRLIIVPRHIERKNELNYIIKSKKFQPVFFADRNNKNEFFDKDKIYVMDEIGWLNPLYSICSIAFVGGSLKKYGGHNIIEPALFSKPIIVGPYMSNFKAITKQFLKNRAAIQVDNYSSLSQVVKKFLDDKSARFKIGKKAYRMVEENKGATDKIVNLINSYL